MNSQEPPDLAAKWLISQSKQQWYKWAKFVIMDQFRPQNGHKVAKTGHNEPNPAWCGPKKNKVARKNNPRWL